MSESLGLEIDAQLNFAVIDAVTETLRTMIGQDPLAEQTLYNSDVHCSGDISGIINLVQDQTEGLLIMTFPQKTISFLLSQIYGEPSVDSETSIREGVGEFTNIIYASVKKSLNQSGYAFKMTLPNVIIGDHHQIICPKVKAKMTIPFTIAEHPFCILVQAYQ